LKFFSNQNVWVPRLTKINAENREAGEIPARSRHCKTIADCEFDKSIAGFIKLPIKNRKSFESGDLPGHFKHENLASRFQARSQDPL
jgi:hypothetical protein